MKNMYFSSNFKDENDEPNANALITLSFLFKIFLNNP